MTSDTKELTKAITALATAHTEGCSKIADSLSSIANQLKFLGNGDASTQMGAIEGMSMQIKEGLETIGSAVRELAEEIGENKKC